MTKAESKAFAGLLVVALIVGGPIYLVKSVGEAVGWPTVGAIAVISALGLVGFRVLRSIIKSNRLDLELETRKAALLAKYGDAALVERIISRAIWQGQSAEQLRDSIGAPVDIDERIFKTKTSQTWKYHQLSAKRFGLRVMMEDGLVVGWDQKG